MRLRLTMGRIVLAIVAVAAAVWLVFFMDWLAPVPEGEGPLGSGLKYPDGEQPAVPPEPALPVTEDEPY
jgi:hypothetical protein